SHARAGVALCGGSPPSADWPREAYCAGPSPSRFALRPDAIAKRLARDHGAGAGTGLAIVKHIAGAHEWTVAVQSRPGHGATFTIRLPMLLETELRALSRRRVTT